MSQDYRGILFTKYVYCKELRRRGHVAYLARKAVLARVAMRVADDRAVAAAFLRSAIASAEYASGMCAASPKANIRHSKPQSRYAYAALVLLGRIDSFGFGMGQHDR